MNTNVLVPPGAAAMAWGALQLADAPLGWPLAIVLVILSAVLSGLLLVLRTRLEILRQDRFAARTPAQRRDLIELERAKTGPNIGSS